MRKTLWANGYSDEQIERMLRKAEKKETGHSSRGKAHKELGMARPTFVKVHRKHIDPETLDKHDLPWEWDDVGLSTTIWYRAHADIARTTPIS